VGCPRKTEPAAGGERRGRRSGVRAGEKIGRTAAPGCGGAKGEVRAGRAAAEGWGDDELELAGVRAAMATAFRGVGVEKEEKNATNSSVG
jgi:hypothetical protein